MSLQSRFQCTNISFHKVLMSTKRSKEKIFFITSSLQLVTLMPSSTSWKKVKKSFKSFSFFSFNFLASDLNAQNDDGNTVLHLCCIFSAHTLLKTLLQSRKVDLSIKNKEGKTAKQICEESQFPGSLLF